MTGLRLTLPGSQPLVLSLIPAPWRSRMWPLGLALGLAWATPAAKAQTIVPAADGTGTQVQQVGGEYAIGGGTQAGSNLFHSFETFGLNTGEIANFLADPAIANILGRVTGGDASYINGLLQVSNSNANLFLMNPAGLVLGPNARLDLGGSFTATTATAIGLDSGWFPAIGTPDYSALVGSPNRFHFSTIATQASIVNQGNLAVNPGQGLMVAGGTVVNTGNLTAPGGSITLLSVPDPQVIRLSQTGMVLNLEFAPPSEEPGLDSGFLAAQFNPLGLPDLLTGGSLQNATDLTVEANGTVRLGGSGLAIPQQPGTTIASGILDTRSTTTIGGAVNILGDRVGLGGAEIDASGTTGGHIRIGGDYQGQGTLPQATVTIVDRNSQLRANGGLQAGDLGGGLGTGSGAGSGGTIIVWSQDTTYFQGQAQAQGGALGGNGGLVETSGKVYLDTTGATINTRAPLGQAGTWLLDPQDLTIAATGIDAGITGNPNFTTVGSLPSLITAGTLTSALATNNVTLTTAGGTGGNGNITLATTITSSSGNSLTLTSSRFLLSTVGLAFNLSGPLTFNLNAVTGATTPTPGQLGESVKAAHDAIGSVAGVTTPTQINLAAGTYAMDTGSLNLSKPVTIQGAGAGTTVIQGSTSDRAIKVTNTTGTVTIGGVTIANGTASISTGSGGGGINNSGTLVLQNSQVQNNTSTVYGGGIATGTTGTLTITNTTFSGNTAPKAGAIYNAGVLTLTGSTIQGNSSTTTNGGGFTNATSGTATIVNTTFSGNVSASRGGAIAHYGSALSLNNSTITGNTATNEGGGIFSNNISGVMTLNGGTIANNTSTAAGGGVYSAGGTVSLTGVNVSNNTSALQGGGLYNNNTSILSLTGVTLTQNTASQGAGVYSTGLLSVDRSALINNTATLRGGGILALASVTLTKSTLSGNQAPTGSAITVGSNLILTSSTVSSNITTSPGSAVEIVPSGGGTRSVSLGNSIVAGNSTTGSLPDVGGVNVFNDQGGNLIGVGSASLGFTTSTLLGTAASPLNPRLAPLGNYGGPTLSYALLPDSPAINGGLNSLVPTVTTTDQRGFTRIANGTVDIGSVESQGFGVVLVGGDGQTATVNQFFANPLQIRLIASETGTPLGGFQFQFTAPFAGASVQTPLVSTVTDANGIAQVSLQANTIAGAYPVILTPIAGFVFPVFNLTNQADAPQSITLLQGNGQITPLLSAFPQELVVQVRDQFGNLLPNTPVVFQGSSEPNGPSIGLGSATILTDSQGIARLGVGANGTPGTFQVVVRSGLASNIFTLTNQGNPPPLPIVPTLPSAPTLPNISIAPPGNPGSGSLPNPELEPLDYQADRPLQEPPLSAIVPLSPVLETPALAENRLTQSVSQRLGVDATELLSPQDIREKLKQLDAATGTRSAVYYVTFESTDLLGGEPQASDPMILTLISAYGDPVRQRTAVTRNQITRMVEIFRDEVLNPQSQRYLPVGQRIYTWMIQPMAATLKEQNIDTLLFSLDEGLRALPVAALQDGQQFLVENYRLGLTPSFSLTPTEYESLRDRPLLAMGASQFTHQLPLPAVPVELDTISETFEVQPFLNENFTLSNLITQKAQQKPAIIHLATHAAFMGSGLGEPYIQFWDQQVSINSLRDLDWFTTPPVDLLVLSACQTALGDSQSELGFAGLAVLSGVRSALASLWSVSDEGTLGLMLEFYDHLKTSPVQVKAEALRQAQLSMMRGDVVIDGQSLQQKRGQDLPLRSVPLPMGAAGDPVNLTHPYYWAGFTLVGSPW